MANQKCFEHFMWEQKLCEHNRWMERKGVKVSPKPFLQFTRKLIFHRKLLSCDLIICAKDRMLFIHIWIVYAAIRAFNAEWLLIENGWIKCNLWRLLHRSPLAWAHTTFNWFPPFLFACAEMLLNRKFFNPQQWFQQKQLYPASKMQLLL